MHTLHEVVCPLVCMSWVSKQCNMCTVRIGNRACFTECFPVSWQQVKRIMFRLVIGLVFWSHARHNTEGYVLIVFWIDGYTLIRVLLECKFIKVVDPIKDKKIFSHSFSMISIFSPYPSQDIWIINQCISVQALIDQMGIWMDISLVIFTKWNIIIEGLDNE